MLSGGFILFVSFAYLLLLFAIAYYGDARADARRSIVNNPYIYALSIAVYCTSWTFYGSVGRAASAGIGFLPIYLGPTLGFALGWFVLRKIIRISKSYHVTSIADFIASRYGKSHLLGGLVTVIAVVGIMPYISLQLKAVSGTFDVLLAYAEPELGPTAHGASVWQDTAFYVALVLAAFAVLFGTRHIDATEQHEGMVAAIAFESVVKLLAFLAVGLFVTFGMFGGVGDLFGRAAAFPDLARLMTLEAAPAEEWVTLTLLAMAAIICLPRQFQVMVVETHDERHLDQAVWLFPLYLFAINLFVLPIALAGLLHFGTTVDADTFVLALPLASGHPWLALFVFIGGLSAATGMMIVATIALSTMICNDLVMPVLLRFAWLHLSERRDLSGLLLGIRRASIVLIALLGYVYFHLIGESYALVTIGLVSFVAAAQFAPAILGGIYWRGGSRRGALGGLAVGFALWTYTLLLPSFARSGWLPDAFIEGGPFGIELLRPYALFGLEGLGHVAHALFWTLLGNLGAYVGLSLADRPSAVERNQATLFVEVERQTGDAALGELWRGRAAINDLRRLAERFVGPTRAHAAFTDYARRRGLDIQRLTRADAGFVRFTERLLAGAIGGASARVLVASVVKGEDVTLDEMMEILDEASQVIEYSRQLEQKSRQLEIAHAELQEANRQLQELDRVKDEFLSTVTHELRTPLTSIRSFSEILHDSEDMPHGQRQQFLEIIIRESERLTRLINNVLDLARIETGRMEWQVEAIDMAAVVRDSVTSLAPLLDERGVRLDLDLPRTLPQARGDHDRLMQVVINLVSNAAKAYRDRPGPVRVGIEAEDGHLLVSVADQGPGLPPEEQERIFDKFYQPSEVGSGNPSGSGLGLAICRRIVEHLGGRIWVDSVPGEGATFRFTVPRADTSR